MTDPSPDSIHEYPEGHYPYVVVSLPGEQMLHARVKAWTGDLIQIEYPPRTAAGTFEGDPETRWVHKDAAQQVRRADEQWTHTDDAMQWHMDRDKAIEFRLLPLWR